MLSMVSLLLALLADALATGEDVTLELLLAQFDDGESAGDRDDVVVGAAAAGVEDENDGDDWAACEGRCEERGEEDGSGGLVG